VITLDATDGDEVEILANDMPIARGVLVVSGSRISVEITDMLRRPSGNSRAEAVLEDMPI
jgi:flagellar motor switch protein FliN/FliY